jgi:hypothetical protein
VNTFLASTKSLEKKTFPFNIRMISFVNASLAFVVVNVPKTLTNVWKERQLLFLLLEGRVKMVQLVRIQLAHTFANVHPDLLVNSPASFSSNFSLTYKGQFCEQSLSICEQQRPCGDRGECQDLEDGKSYQCRCHGNFTGKNCQVNCDSVNGNIYK